MTGSPAIERASTVDLMELAAATTPAAGQVGAVLILEPGEVDLPAVRSAFDERIRGVPRLRQRLRSAPWGCGRPHWVDDGAFDIADHVHETGCPAPGDRAAVLAIAAGLVAQPLDDARPLWTVRLVTGLAGGGTALVVVFHHVMADGMGGLAVLADLVDGAAVRDTPEFPRAAPGPAALCADALRARLRQVARLGSALPRVREAATELGARPPTAPRCSLNAPVGPDRCLAVADGALDAVHTAAHAHGVSVNDAALAAITGALRRFLTDRHEAVDDVVVSIPVSARDIATAAELGNRIGVMAVALPSGGPPGARMEAIGAVTRARKRGARGSSAALLAPVFRVLAAVGALRWVTDHQHMVNTFVTNLRGPDAEVSFLGRTVEELIPVGSTSGNVRVAFGVFSYAGVLTISVVADAGFADELADLVGDLRNELDAVIAALGPDE
jgi:WS/DGAT/MGAT family acyltransferase